MPELDEASFREFVDRWNSFQTAQLLANSRSLVQYYENLRRNPSIDGRTGKPQLVTPSGVLMSSRSLSLAQSPAVNMFEKHAESGASALIGPITEEAARLRIWVEDRRAVASWFFFALRKNGKLSPGPAFRDIVGLKARSLRLAQEAKPIADAAYAKGVEDSSGQTKSGYFETRTLRFADTSCIACHSNQKPGDFAGVMVYIGWKEPTLAGK